MHTYNYGLKHYMFVLNLACLFFLKTSGSLSSAVMLSSCCIKHRIGGVEHVVLKANTAEVDIFTGSMLAQMHTKTDWICLWKSAQSSIIRKHYCSKINYFNKIKTSTIATICLELLCIWDYLFSLKNSISLPWPWLDFTSVLLLVQPVFVSSHHISHQI